MTKLLSGLVVAACVCAAGSRDVAGQPADGSRRELAPLVQAFRRARADVDRQVKAIDALCEAGEAGVREARALIEAEIARQQDAVKHLPAAESVPQRIAQLRKVMKDLRQDDALTKEKIVETGDPTMSELGALHAEWATGRRAVERKTAVPVAQLLQLAQLIDKLQAEWDLQGRSRPLPLPLDPLAERIDQLLAAIVSPAALTIRRVDAANAVAGTGLESSTAAGVATLNSLRIVLGLDPLVIDPELCEAASGHSRDMETRDFFSHVSPVPGKKTFQDRAQRAGTTASGENIYFGSTSSDAAVKAWFHSPPHHKNMFGDHRRVGLGRSGKIWTLMFGR